MIVEFDAANPVVKHQVESLHADGMMSSVQLTIARSHQGLYHAQLTRVTTTPARLEGMQLGVWNDVPVGNRRATWLLTDVVDHMLELPEAHRLLHW